MTWVPLPAWLSSLLTRDLRLSRFPLLSLSGSHFNISFQTHSTLCCARDAVIQVTSLRDEAYPAATRLFPLERFRGKD
jgi:hypothetical protein